MKKLRRMLIAFILVTICISGCGSTIPDMTQEQETQIVEYAAGLLLKYNKDTQTRIMTEEELTAYDAMKQEEARIKAQIEEEARKAAEPAPTADTEVIDNSETVEPASLPIEDFYSLSGIQIQYNGHIVTDFYPQEATDEESLFFEMNATPNNQLLVLNFDVSNNSEEEANVDMIAANAKFKVSVNGESPKNALLTMLLNDLSTFQGSIAPEETKELVLVIEIPTNQADSIQSLTLSMKNVDSNQTINLE